MISKYSAFYSTDYQIFKDMVLSKYCLSFLFMDVRRNEWTTIKLKQFRNRYGNRHRSALLEGSKFNVKADKRKQSCQSSDSNICSFNGVIRTIAGQPSLLEATLKPSLARFRLADVT